MVTDPIADLLTRIRNGIMARQKVVEVPASNLKLEIIRVLHEKGYISKFKYIEAKPQGVIKIALKYHKVTKQSAITNLTRVSKPGLRKYAHVEAIPRILNGMGIAILSTSKGVMTDKEARKENIGGEILCYVY
jgi:small subunit ribosomal protein S8